MPSLAPHTQLFHPQSALHPPSQPDLPQPHTHTQGSPGPPCSHWPVSPTQCPHVSPHPHAKHHPPPCPTHLGGSPTWGLGVPGPQGVVRKGRKSSRPPCAAAAERLCQYLLSLQKQELKGARCVAFPAALAARSQKHRRRRRRRRWGRRGGQPWREDRDPAITSLPVSQGSRSTSTGEPKPRAPQHQPNQSPHEVCTCCCPGFASSFLAA